jgi:predicted AlkP superfamily phosphohydrolase/phosphomutase
MGREPLGCVQPGAAYEQVRDDIITRLGELRDPETGEGVVDTIYRREEVYSGEQLEHAPDILFIPRRLEYFGFGEYEFGSHRVIEAMKRGISGTHRMNGIFLAYGRAIQPGIVLDDAQIVDLAPTILHLMGEPIPEHMDGAVALEALRGAARIARPMTQPSAWNGRPDGEGDGLTEQEKQALADRLRSLGYVG